MFDLADLKAKTDLLAIVEADLGPSRKHTGRWYSWPCPFHADSDQDGGSLRVTPDTGTWFCFGCQKSGDVIAWLQFRQNVSFREACKQLGGQFGVLRGHRLPVPASQKQPDKPPDDLWQKEAEAIVARCAAFLWSGSGDRVRDYLHKRGLDDATLKRWEIGYNPSRCFIQGIKTVGDKPAVFSRGITIPIRLQQKLWGLKVRQPDGFNPKYVQLAGGKSTLFGADTLNKPIVLLTEGEFDAMLAWQEAGDLVGVASTTGGAATWRKDWAIHLLKAQQILVAYDTDKTGNEAASVVASLSTRAKRVMVPSGKDITEYWQAGGKIREWLLSLFGQKLPPIPSQPCPICSNTEWEWQQTGWTCSVCGPRL